MRLFRHREAGAWRWILDAGYSIGAQKGARRWQTDKIRDRVQALDPLKFSAAIPLAARAKIPITEYLKGGKGKREGSNL